MTWGRGSTRAWRDLRARILERDPYCRIRDAGCTLLSTRADHIVPIAEGGDEWDELNLQGACQSCHDRKSQAEAARGRARKRVSRQEPHPGIIVIPPDA